MESEMELNLQQCPLCGTELSGVKFKEIQAKISRDERENAAKLAQTESALRLRLEQQFSLDLEKQRQALQKKAQEDAERRISQIAAELGLAAKRLKEAEAREIEIRKQAEQDLAREKLAVQVKAKQEADQQIRQASAERDELAKKLREAQQREAEVRKEAAQEIEKEKRATEAKSKADAAEQIGKLVRERDQAAAAAREAEAKAKVEAAEQINKLVLERNQAAARAKEAEAREAGVRKQVTEEAEREKLNVLTNQRQTLETDKKLALLKQQAEFNREREAVQKKMQLLERQLQKKTANELGDGAEIDVYETLREYFRTDSITRVPKGQPGPDIVHEVLYKGDSCGRIVVDSKNRQIWKNEYVTKLRQDQVEAGAEHAVLTTTIFPAGKKEMCIESGVIVVSPARAVYIVQLLRSAMVTMHVKGLSMKERSTKMAMLYNLITSDSYARKFAEANRLADEILKLDVDEKKAHDNVWKKRGSLTKQVQNVLREAETEVAAVVEGTDGDEAPSAFGVKGAPALSVASRRQEIV
jgi:Uncharacterized protein conserved in bacteria (DUF2130)